MSQMYCSIIYTDYNNSSLLGRVLCHFTVGGRGSGSQCGVSWLNRWSRVLLLLLLLLLWRGVAAGHWVLVRRETPWLGRVRGGLSGVRHWLRGVHCGRCLSGIRACSSCDHTGLSGTLGGSKQTVRCTAVDTQRNADGETHEKHEGTNRHSDYNPHCRERRALR